MNIFTNSDAHQADPPLSNVSLLQEELESLSLGTTLRLKHGYFANYQQRAKNFDSLQKTDLPLDSTGSQYDQCFNVNNKKCNRCQFCSECDHMELQTCGNTDKCTQENSCKMLNPKPLNSVDGAIKACDVDTRSDKAVANSAENRIHKRSGFRQNMSAPPISLNECSKRMNETGQKEAGSSSELQYEEKCTKLVPQQNPQTLKQSDQQKNVYHKGDGFRYNMYDDQKSGSEILKPIHVESFNHRNEVINCCPMASRSSYNATYSHSRELYPAQLESTHSNISKQRAQDIMHVADDTAPKEWPHLSLSYAGQARQMKSYACSSDDSRKLDKITSECYKGVEKTKCSSISGSKGKNDAEVFILYSGKHLEVLTYILSVIVIILAFTVMHLYVKIQSLEASRDVVFNTKYQCGEKPLILDEQHLGGDTKTETNEKLTALFSTSKLLMVNTKKGTYKHRNDILDLSGAGVEHNEVNKQFNKYGSYESNIPKASPPTTDTEITSASRNSSRTEVTLTSSAGASRFESSDVGVHRAVLSRVVRSADGKQKGFNDRKKWNNRRKDFCKGFKNGCKTQIDSFEGHFFRVIDYKQKLMTDECTSHEKWDPDIKACRGNTVFFPKQYTVLPFYLETNVTAVKKQKKRLVVTDDKGRFQIQKRGEYLIHVNITVVDPKGTQFLAVYLNNEAVLACPDGGFPCPNTNDKSSVKYRICNIIGLLEFNKNDTVDIRTMEPNMTVRLEKTKRSHFRFVLLN